jgi:hypothetical protein
LHGLVLILHPTTLLLLLLLYRLPNFFLAKAPHPYRATTSSAAYNGWDGFMIIPRWAQAVDYNVPDAAVMLQYYQ